METRAHYVLIGAFMLVGVAMLFLFVLWLGRAEREFDEYDVVFTERVTGLSEGADVRFNGIKVGEVRDLHLDADNPNRVIARIRVSKDTPVKVETKASLELVGITGLSLIQLTGGEPGSPLLKTVSDRNIPVIEAETSDLAMLLESSNDIISAVNKLLRPENVERITDTLENVRDVTAAFAGRKEEIGALIDSLGQTSRNVEQTTADLNRITERLDALIENDGADAVENFEATSEEARLLMQELREAVAENRDALKDFSEQGLQQVAPAIADARRTMRTLDSLLREVERDPRGFLLGDSRPRYDAGGSEHAKEGPRK